MNLHWITCVWGQEFTEYFIKAVIPNQLSPLNLPICCGKNESIYKIYTTRHDAEMIRNASVFRRLTEVVCTQVVIIEDVFCDADIMLAEILQDTHGLMNRCHAHAVLASQGMADVAFVFLPPDAIFSEGSFAAMLEIANSGKRAIMIPGLRVVKENFAPMFLQNFYSESSQAALVTSRQLARCVMDYLHPLMESSFYDSDKFSEWASILLWRAPGQGILARCFHLHPIFVRPLDRAALPRDTIDGDFLVRACPNLEDVYVVEDSDEILCVEATTILRSLPDWIISRKPYHARPRVVGSFAAEHCDTHHLAFFKHNIRIHSEDISAAWTQIENNADRIEKSVLKWQKIQSFVDRFPTIIAMIAWLQRLNWAIRKKVRFRTRLKSFIGRVKLLASGANKV